MTRRSRDAAAPVAAAPDVAPAAVPAAVPAAYQSLYEVGRLLLASVDLEDVLQGIAAGLCHFAGCTRSVIVDFDQDTGRMRGLVGHGVPAVLVAQIHTYLFETPLVRAVLETGAAVFVHDPTPDNSVPARYLEAFGVEGTLAVAPLNSDELGILGMAFTDRAGTRFRFDQTEQEVFTGFCELGALAMQNAMLVERSQQLAAMLERSRIATELHDGVTQLLFSAGMGLEEALDHPGMPEEAGEMLRVVRCQINEGGHQLRQALFELARPTVSSSDTLGAIRAVLEDFRERTGATVDVQIAGRGTDLTGHRRKLAVRTVSEALRNVEKHADATQVLIRVRRGNAWWMVDVDDDGLGDPPGVRRHLSLETERFGLYSLSQEAERLQGRLWVVRAPRLGGVCVSLSLPVTASGGSS